MGAMSPVTIREESGLGNEADSWPQDVGTDVAQEAGLADDGGGDGPAGERSPPPAAARPVSRRSVLRESDDPAPEHGGTASDEAAPSPDTANDMADEEPAATSLPTVEPLPDDNAAALPNPADALNRLVEDPRYRTDRAYADYVTRQFERVYGTDGTTDATGRLVAEGDFSGFAPLAERSVPADAEDGGSAAPESPLRDPAERPNASSRVASRDGIEAWLRDRTVEVAENPKAKTATDAVTVDGGKKPDIPELPSFKVDYFKSQPRAWEDFNEALAQMPNLSANQRLIYAKIFAMEGGMTTHPTSGAASGITQDILDLAEDLPGLEKVRKPDQLAVRQRAAIYPYYFDDVLRTVGGRKALDEIGNDEAAAAFADTLFRFGRGRGTEIIQDAMNQVFEDNGYPKMPKDKQMGPGTLAAYSYLATSENLAEQLSDKLVERRVEMLRNQKNNESDRSRYFVFSRKKR